MTTIVNTPASSGSDNNGNGSLFVGIFILIILGFLFFYFGIPAIEKMRSGQINTPEIVVPDKIDVNVNQTN